MYQSLDYVELMFVAAFCDKFDTEFRRNHRKRTKTPAFPVFCIIGWLLKRTEMPEGPGYRITVPFVKAVTFHRCAENIRNIFGDTWFLCYTDNHPVMLFNILCRVQASYCRAGHVTSPFTVWNTSVAVLGITPLKGKSISSMITP